MKKFNPKKCPYKQLLEHKGSAIIFVESRNNKEAPKVRYMHKGKFLYATVSDPGKERDNEFTTSCFALENPYSVHKVEKKNKAEIIEAMKKWDNDAYSDISMKETIVYIEFY